MSAPHSIRRAALRGVCIPGAITLLCAATATGAAAQSGSLPDAPSLRAPGSPAFVLLGVSPTDVYKPRSPADLAFTALARSNELASIPKDLALETSPYWLFAHPTLTWRADSVRNLAQSVARTTALSFATTELDTGTSSRTAVGVGIRTSLLSGHLSDSTKKLLRALEQNAIAQGRIYNGFLAPLIASADAELRTRLRLADAQYQNDPTGKAREQEAALAAYNIQKKAIEDGILANPAYLAQIAAERKKISDFALEREGLLWDLAGGASWQFPGDVWENGAAAKYGAWTTIAYDGESFGLWSPILAVRFLHDALAADRTGTLDVGGRILRSAGDYGVSLEFVDRHLVGHRTAEGRREQYRVTGMFEYRVAADAWLTTSFGRAYDDDKQRGNLVAQIGLAFAFHRDRYVEAAPH